MVISLRSICSVALLLSLFSGCSVKKPTALESRVKVNRLTKMIVDLDRGINPQEADDLARSSIYYVQDLITEYRLVSPPLWQNALVNMGLKNRGLCYQWANDLYHYLKRKEYQTLTLHYVGANISTYKEHNALSVSARGRDINGSILLDAWRNSGDLYYKKIEEDKKYKWSERLDME